MLRPRLSVALSSVAISVAAFGGATWATASSGSADLPQSLPASQLARTPIPDSERVAINNLIPLDEASRYGIVPSSFDNARLLAATELGPLIILPGTNGACLILSSTSACTGKLDGRPTVLALLVPNAAGFMVGGGLTTVSGSVPDIVDEAGLRVQTTPTLGGFTVAGAQGVRGKAWPRLSDSE